MSLDAYPLVRDWLRVSSGSLVLRSGKVELGQRIHTALVRIAMEELGLPHNKVSVAPLRTGDGPDEGITSGSNSIEQSGRALRLACASARNDALSRVALQFNTEPQALRLDAGRVSHPADGRAVDLIDILSTLSEDLPVDAAAVPREQAAPLPDLPPSGLREMVEGRYIFIHDIERPGMMHARIVRPPMIDAVLKDLNAQVVAKLEASGVHVLRDGSFVAVAGKVEWAVVRAAVTLGSAATWDAGAGLETEDVFDLMQRRAAQMIAVIDGQPDTAAAVPDCFVAPDFAARVERPYTLHGALAPSAALATFFEGKLEILTHSQGVYFLRDSIADSLGMALDDVVLQHVPGSGCYGHNCADDAAFEAALIARALPDVPILLKYDRMDEHAREPVGPAMTVSIEAKVSPVHHIGSVWMEARGDTHRGRPRKGPNRAGPARLAANRARETDVPRFVPEPNMNRHAGLHRNLDPAYDFAEKKLVKALVNDLPLRTSALRCLGAPANVLAIESMMDELAERAGVDPISYRLQHLSDPRAVDVLRQLRAKLENAGATGEPLGRGIAYAQYKNSMTRVAVAVDLAVDDSAAVRLDRAWIVADAGRAVDPDGLRAQLEGGFLQGASWALHEKVLWGPEGRDRLDWESYPVLRFDNIPKIDTTIVEHQNAEPVGAGEATPGPSVAAIANGVFGATGLRLRRMPFDQDAIMKAALNA